jgi:glutamyl/glutaminyl-tRNA synthetase
MRKVMDLMKIRIHFFHDMKNHTYFFTDPAYNTPIAEKFLTKLMPNSSKILPELSKILSALPVFDTPSISQACSQYVKSNSLKNDEVYSLLRFAITGNPVGAPVGDICEIVGKEAVCRRLQQAKI